MARWCHKEAGASQGAGGAGGWSSSGAERVDGEVLEQNGWMERFWSGAGGWNGSGAAC